MRVATLADGSADGRLVIVSENGQSCRPAKAATLRDALDGAGFDSDGPEMEFDEAACLAPLPRAAQFLDGSAYVNHVELVRRARGVEMPERFWSDPLMYQGCSDPMLAPRAPISGKPDWGIDFEAEIAVITTAVPQGIGPDAAAGLVAFVMLINDISLRGLIPDELSKGFGFVQSKPPSSCSPLAVSPEDLTGWDGRKLSGAVCVDLNGTAFGRADAGVDMTFDFGQLIAHAAKTRSLPAGTVIGSGTVSNKLNGGPGKPVAEGGVGYSCIAEQRMVETIENGTATTPFLSSGDRVRIWMEDAAGAAIFGTIDQEVKES